MGDTMTTTPPSDDRSATPATPVPTTSTSERRRPGWRAVARKEFTDHLRSMRFLLLVVLLSLSAIGAVVAAANRLRDAAPEAAELSSVFLRVFTIELADTPFSFVSFVALIGPLLGIAFGFDAISSERSDRTLPRLLSQPIHRDDVINGKFVAGLVSIALVLTTLTAAVTGIVIVALGAVPTGRDLGRLVVWLVVSVV